MTTLKDINLSANEEYINTWVKRKGENKFYKISRTSNKILFYFDSLGTERRLFPNKVEQITEGNQDNSKETENRETRNYELNQDNNFLFQSEYNPFFNNDFIWAITEDFCNGQNEMFT